MSRTPRIIYVIDDDETARSAAGLLLNEAGYESRLFGSGEAFLKVLGGMPAGCVLLNLRLQELEGLAVLQRLRALGVTMPVILRSGDDNVALAVAAIKAGATDFILKTCSREALLRALDDAFAATSARSRPPRSRDRRLERINSLTVREREVLLGLVHGRTNKLIAQDLGLSPRTIEIHRAKLMKRLGAKTLSDVLALAFAANLASPNAFLATVKLGSDAPQQRKAGAVGRYPL
jgi:two-component system, LuxR family, response regulator FixJ